MHKFDVRLDVSEAAATGESLEVVATVVAPSSRATPTVAIFGYPGGGYNRRYYDLPIEGGYSQAEHHAQQGIVFVACDHLGVGDSSVPSRPLDYAAVARANSAAATSLLEQLRAGVLGLPPLGISTAIGIGQSFGGLVLTIGEGHAPVFDAVALLGWSGVQTLPPWADDVDVIAMASGRAGNGLDHPMRAAFHGGDVPEAIVLADMTKRPGGGSDAPWSTDHMPGGPAVDDPGRNPLQPGVVATEAAAIATPVFVGAGVIDVIPDVHDEPAAYRSSPDVTACVFPGMAHMHNFATTRHVLWERLGAWALTVATRHRHQG